MRILCSTVLASTLLAGCNGGTGADTGTTQAYSGIAEDEVIDFGGNEPFWGGTIAGDTMTYSTPENIDGTSFQVERFAGNNGLSFTGDMNGTSVTMTVTPGECGDGMSDRTYPFTVTLQLGEAVRNGCAHTDKQPFTGPVAP